MRWCFEGKQMADGSDERLTHADALDLDSAVVMIADDLSLPVGAAQLKLIEACGSGMVLAWERIPERGHDDVYWWDCRIPAAEWKDANGHIDSDQGLVFLKGNAYGSRTVSERRLSEEKRVEFVKLFAADIREYLAV
jgi:hypothetical protein